jgi:multiple sugar transport system substrate-binding protein
MSSTRFLPTGALAALCVTVVACGGGGSGSSSAGTGKSIKGQTITYWASNQGASIDQDKQVLTGEIAQFKQQTGVNVDFKVIPWPDLFNNITTATTSGKGPDVLNIGNTWSATLQATGAFMKFDDKTLNAIGGKDRFLQTSFAATGAEGQEPTSVPLYGLSYGLIYNKRLVKDAGIAAPPKTWTEFVADGKKLTKDTDGDGKPDQWGFALEGGSITENSHWAFILGQQKGANLFDGDTPKFDTPEMVSAVKQYIDFVGADKISSPNNAAYSDGTQAIAQFSKGKTGMLVWQNNVQNNLKANGVKPSEYAIADVPVFEGSSNPIMTHVAGINVSIFDNSQHKDAALAFVKFLTSKDQQVKLNQKFNSLPVVKEAQSDPAFSSENLKTFNSILADHAAPMPEVPQEGQMETLIGQALKGLFAKAATQGDVSDADVKAALTSANEKMAAAGG